MFFAQVAVGGTQRLYAEAVAVGVYLRCGFALLFEPVVEVFFGKVRHRRGGVVDAVAARAGLGAVGEVELGEGQVGKDDGLSLRAQVVPERDGTGDVVSAATAGKQDAAAVGKAAEDGELHGSIITN